MAIVPQYIRQSWRIITSPSVLGGYLNEIEMAARCCYKGSDIRGIETPEHKEIQKEFIKNLISKGHESPIEFGNLHVIIVTNRGVCNEIERHRLFSFCQESTRYVNYLKQGHIDFIFPKVTPVAAALYRKAAKDATKYYEVLLRFGCKPQEARNVLPLATATMVHVAGNFREWRHFFKLRTAPDVYPEMRELACGLRADLLKLDGMDVIFG